MRLRSVEIKPDECLTHGCCAHDVPEIFEERRDGSFGVRSDAASRYDELQIRIEEMACDICPVRAIHLVYEDGTEKYPAVDFDALEPATPEPSRNLWPVLASLLALGAALWWWI